MKIGSNGHGAPQRRAWDIVATAVAVGTGVLPNAAAARPPETVYETLTYGTSSTFVTGIRGTTIVGNYVIPATGETGGLLYDLTTETWSALPFATENGVNFPNAIGSSPYGPSFGTQTGALRAVGTYQTTASDPYDLSYLYDAAAAPGQELTYLAYPDGNAPTLYTVAHSTFGNQVVGDYDTELLAGNAFTYNIDTGVYTNNNYKEGLREAFSSTAYGIYGDKIAGGYAFLGDNDPTLAHGYVYNQSTDTFLTYDHPSAIPTLDPSTDSFITHFEGITGGGRANTYNLVADWVNATGPHAGVMHINYNLPTADPEHITWYELNIPGQIVSSNSAYGDKIIGVYVEGGVVYSFVAPMPAGFYTPILNASPLTVASDTATGIATDPGGDDVINSSSILVSGANSIGIAGETYGVISNTGTITVTGAGSSGVRMSGTFGTLLNSGTMTASAGADALTTGTDPSPGRGEIANGTVFVNTGVIDGRVTLAAGPTARFDNSGWLGVTTPGAVTAHQISGTFVQTAQGTLGLQVGATASDTLQTDIARLDGTLATNFIGESFQRSYTILTASQEITGAFATYTPVGLPGLFASTLSYGPTSVTLNIAADVTPIPGLTPNELAVGAALAGIINALGSPGFAALPDALRPLYALDASQLPQALDALSGESYASEQSVLLGDGLFSRRAVLDRLRQGAYAGQGDALAQLSNGGPILSASTKGTDLGFGAQSTTTWAQAFGSRTELDGETDTSDVSSNFGGLMTGADTQVESWRVGAAIGYTQSSTTVDDLSSSSDVDSLMAALYAGTGSGPWSVRLGATYASNQTDATRTIAYPGFAEQASADYNSATTQLFAEVAYGLVMGTAAVEPFAGLAWINVDTDGFSETGATAGLSVSSSSSSVTYGTLGVRAATSVVTSGGMVVQPRGSLAWQTASGDLSPSAQMAFLSAPNAGFTVGGAPLADNAALIEIGADLLISDQAQLGLSYVGQYADGVSSYGLQATMTWTF
jgi:subtilase-type serine protease